MTKYLEVQEGRSTQKQTLSLQRAQIEWSDPSVARTRLTRVANSRELISERAQGHRRAVVGALDRGFGTGSGSGGARYRTLACTSRSRAPRNNGWKDRWGKGGSRTLPSAGLFLCSMFSNRLSAIDRCMPHAAAAAPSATRHTHTHWDMLSTDSVII